MVDDLFKIKNSDYKEFCVFQDEAECKQANYFYHGFLFIDKENGRNILNNLISIKNKNNRRYERIHFNEIKNSLGGATRIALEWIDLSRKWLESGLIKFYFFGINRNNFSNFWNNTWNFEKNIYLKSFEIGFNASIGWFREDKKLNRPFMVSDVFYEYGPYKDERSDKIEWLDLSFSNSSLNCNCIKPIWGDELKQQKEDKRFSEYSNLVQLVDLLLGVCKYSFIKINPKHKGKQKCVDGFIDIVEKFNNDKDSYDFLNNKLCWNFRINFFPRNKVNKDEFLIKTDDYYLKMKGNFYCNRETYSQIVAQNKLQKLL